MIGIIIQGTVFNSPRIYLPSLFPSSLFGVYILVEVSFYIPYVSSIPIWISL